MMCGHIYITNCLYPKTRAGRLCHSVFPRVSAFKLGLALLACFWTVNAARAVDVRLEGEQLWLNAQHASLHEVMRGFAHIGVRVQMDPALQARITATIENQDVERALADLFDEIGYVLIWEVMEGPVGSWPQLTEIHVFQPGNRDQMRPLEEPDAFRVQAMPDGSGIEFIADEILIGFAPDARQDALRVLIRQLGGTVVESLPELGIYRIRLPPGANVPALVAQLARNPLVTAVEPNYAYRMPLPARDAPPGTSVSGPVRAPREGAPPVAVLDSGLTMLRDMEGLIVGGFNALDPDQPPTDTAGHGTQMALIGTGAVRPAGLDAGEGVPVIPIRAFNDEGVTSNFAQMRSLFHAADEGAAVLNMSWGSPADSAFLEHAINKARGAGMLVVASAGNEPLNEPMYPAAYPDVIGVSAALPDGSPWPQTNYGDFIFVAAPGTATFPVGYQGEPGSYAGTSIAAATVSHALGLYYERHPGATPRQARDALRRAVTVEGQAWDPHRGHGVLDQEALERLLR